MAGPPARRRLPRAEREQLILDEAEKAFSARGFHAASMDEIAAGAGVTKPIVYSYFGAKHGLFVATVGRAGERLTDELVATGAVTEPRARVQATVRAFFTFAADHGDAWTLALGQADSDVAEAVAQARARITGLLAAGLEQTAEDLGAPPPGAVGAAALAGAVMGAGERLALWASDGGDWAVAQDLLVRLVLGGLAAP